MSVRPAREESLGLGMRHPEVVRSGSPAGGEKIDPESQRADHRGDSFPAPNQNVTATIGA